MVRIFETGDIHIGKAFDRYDNVKSELIETRFETLEKMVERAEQEHCEFFVVTGDLFDNNYNINKKDIKRIVNILAQFPGAVLVLPGNHDFYNDSVKVWIGFMDEVSKTDNNIILLNKFEPYTFDAGDGETVVFYPAYCQSKHSNENNLGWIKEAEVDPDHINIGVAHGAIKGVSPDKEMKYFMMSQSELNEIPVDVWLIGHTHVPFPDYMADEETHTGKIFNAGTHCQTDLSNNTAGYCFIIDIEKDNNEKTVTARAVRSGKIRFYDLNIFVTADSDNALDEAVKNAVEGLSDESIIKLNVSGTAKKDEYDNRFEIYETYLKRFLDYETVDNGLSEEITIEKIHSEYAETSFAAKFLEALIEDPKELSMAYEVLKRCKEK